MSNDSEPWRTRGDYEKDRQRMQWVVIAAIVSSVAALVTALATLAALVLKYL